MFQRYWGKIYVGQKMPHFYRGRCILWHGKDMGRKKCREYGNSVETPQKCVLLRTGRARPNMRDARHTAGHTQQVDLICSFVWIAAQGYISID